MGLKPEFMIKADGQDITEKLNTRLRSLRITDEAGLQSDAVEISLADDGIQIPETGAELEVSIGYDGKVQLMGVYIVDSIDLSVNPDTMTIKAKASPQDGGKSGKQALQTQKTRSWPKDTTLADMTKTIAGEHSLTAAVAASMAGIKLPHIDQVNESDINLLTRVVKDYDGVVKPAGGNLVVAKRGESKSASGKELGSIELTPSMISTCRLSMSQRDKAGTVIATWSNLATAQEIEVKAGDGEPVTRLRQTFADAEQAKAAATAEIEKRQRAEQKLSVSLPGDPAIAAESKLVLKGFRDGFNGEWLITKAEHNLDSGGYRCTVSCDKA